MSSRICFNFHYQRGDPVRNKFDTSVKFKMVTLSCKRSQHDNSPRLGGYRSNWEAIHHYLMVSNGSLLYSIEHCQPGQIFERGHFAPYRICTYFGGATFLDFFILFFTHENTFLLLLLFLP